MVILNSTDLAEVIGAPFFARSRFNRWREQFESSLAERLRPGRHGDLGTWLEALQSLPDIPVSEFRIMDGAITVEALDAPAPGELEALVSGLRVLKPWRKGPWNLLGIEVDAEWRSDMKWDRLVPHLGNVNNKAILDIGCGNGYFCWRMLERGAEYVLGIDPSVRFLVQHLAVQRYIDHPAIDLLPLRSEDLPADMVCFDIVLSMGVIYHRRNPLKHLGELLSFLRPGGRLVLETLVLEEPGADVLVPAERYAQMRNVWFIPGIRPLTKLLEEADFEEIECVDITRTTGSEQRCTEWMQFQSLEDFLDPANSDKTIEGYPAPARAILLATKPGR